MRFFKLKNSVNQKIQTIKRWCYKTFYNIDIGLDGSMLPKLGKGQFCSVIRKGNFIDILPSHTDNFVRIVPYWPNHGIMVERWVKGRCVARDLLDYEQLNKNIIYSSNIEELSKRN